MAFDMSVVFRSADPSGFTTAHLRGVDDSRWALAKESSARVRAGEPPEGDMPVSSAGGLVVRVPWVDVVEIRVGDLR